MYIDELKRRAFEIRNSKEYRDWKFAVLERDGRKCVFCGRASKPTKGIKLEVDHIQPFLLYPELMFDVNNGRTLCSKCHRQTSTYGNSKEHREAHKSTVHPFFKGDYLFKIKSVPTCMALDPNTPTESGFSLRFRATSKKWRAGYGKEAVLPNWVAEGDTPEEAIDSFLVGLERVKEQQILPGSNTPHFIDFS